MARKSPAWQRLVSDGIVSSRAEAERWILSGSVRIGSRPVTSAGQPIAEDDVITVRGIDQRYVAKGGLKMEGALTAFGLDISGRICIDAGASTGGFTDCLVKHGAALVYAVDVGYGQLAGSLRANPHVVNLEKTNIGDASLLTLDPSPTLGTVDLSYLSLRKAVPQFAEILHNTGDLICLVKPLFEVDDAMARRTGEISPEAYAPLLYSLARDFTRDGYAVRGIANSPVTGNNGTLEFFVHLALNGRNGLSEGDFTKAADQAVQSALSLPAYHKA